MQPLFEMADVLNAQWYDVLHTEQYNTWQLRTPDAVRRCRTASLGSHIDGCTSCGHLRISYTSRRIDLCIDKPGCVMPNIDITVQECDATKE